MATNKKNPQGKPAAEKLIDLVTNECELIHDQKKKPFAITCKGSVRQVFSLHSNAFKEYIANLYYRKHKSALSDLALKAALSALTGKAVYDGKQLAVHHRIAKTGQSYWLDLCNADWEAVEISASGWAIKSGSSVPLFERSASGKALPNPIGGGTLDALWDVANIPKNDQLLVVAWLLECLRSDTPYVLLELIGEQGSAKSTTQQILKMLIDPNEANLRSAPKNVEDIWVGASNSHLVSFENISYLPKNFQDALCVLATGGANVTRTLYTNKEESIIQRCNPTVMNGISANVTAPDLLDRCLHIELPRVQKRLLSKDVDSQFTMQQPYLLGALLDQFVNALQILPTVTVADSDRPRMLDFAYLGEAVFQSEGFAAGEFLSRYKAMREQGVYRTIEASPIGAALFTYLDKHPSGWRGRAAQLLGLLEIYRQKGEKNWPLSGKAMGDALRRLSPALGTFGFDCRSNPKTGGAYIWQIDPIQIDLPKSSPACPESPAEGLEGLGHAGHAGHEFRDFDYEQTEEPLPF